MNICGLPLTLEQWEYAYKVVPKIFWSIAKLVVDEHGIHLFATIGVNEYRVYNTQVDKCCPIGIVLIDEVEVPCLPGTKKRLIRHNNINQQIERLTN